MSGFYSFLPLKVSGFSKRHTASSLKDSVFLVLVFRFCLSASSLLVLSSLFISFVYFSDIGVLLVLEFLVFLSVLSKTV